MKISFSTFYFVWTLTVFALFRIGVNLAFGIDPGIAGPVFLILSMQVLIILPLSSLISHIKDENN